MTTTEELNLVVRLKDEASGALGGLRNSLGTLGKATALSAGAAATAVAGVGVAAWDVSGDVDAASRNIQNSLGLTADAANDLATAAQNIYNEGFAGSLQEVSTAITDVSLQLDTLDPGEVEGATRSALSLAEAFETDVNKTAHAAGVLMDEFGLTSDEAFDLLASGFQNGLNNADDFLESVGEYSNLFAEGGATADEFFSTMETGMAGGVLGTDKISDAFKEFQIRILESSDSTLEALSALGEEGIGSRFEEQFGVADVALLDTREHAEEVAAFFAEMGLDVDVAALKRGLTTVNEETGEVQNTALRFGDIYASAVSDAVEDGSLSMIDAFGMVTDGLGDMENEVWRNTSGVALLGTQFEDLGDQIVTGIDPTATSLEDMAGAVDNLTTRNETLAGKWDSLIRTLMSSLVPLGEAMRTSAGVIIDALIPIVETYMPILVDWFANKIPAAIAMVVSVFQGGGGALSNFGAMWQTLGQAVGDVVNGIKTVVESIFGVVAQFIRDNQEEIRATVEVVWNQITTIIDLALQLINATIVPMFEGIATFIQTNQNTLVNLIEIAWSTIETVITLALSAVETAIGIVIALLHGDFTAAWQALRDFIANLLPGLQTLIENAFNAVINIIGLVANALGINLQGAFDAAARGWNVFYSVFIQPLIDGFQRIIDVVQGALDKIRELQNLPGTVFEEVGQGFRLITGQLGEDEVVTGFASGTMSAPPGFAVVGEKGPELVNFRGGEQVFPADVSAAMMSGGGTDGVSIGPFSFSFNSSNRQHIVHQAVDEFARQLNGALDQAEMRAA